MMVYASFMLARVSNWGRRCPVQRIERAVAQTHRHTASVQKRVLQGSKVSMC
jgi:hypothetical protein